CQQRNDHFIFGIHGVPHVRAFRLVAQQLEQATGVQINHLRLPVKMRSARLRASAASLRETFPPETFFCQRAWASASQRGRLLPSSMTHTSLATGLESRVMRISFSIFNAASASGQRWRKSRIVIVFMVKV